MAFGMVPQSNVFTCVGVGSHNEPRLELCRRFGTSACAAKDSAAAFLFCSSKSSVQSASRVMFDFMRCCFACWRDKSEKTENEPEDTSGMDYKVIPCLFPASLAPASLGFSETRETTSKARSRQGPPVVQ